MNRSLAIAALCGLFFVHPATAFDEPAVDKDAVSLFDGKTLAGWKETDFAGHGEVHVDDGTIVLELGDAMTGITITPEKFAAAVPKINYEIQLDAMRVDGNGFCGLTFPVGKDPCSLIVGGWGGSVVGLSSLNGEDASQNETTTFQSFNKGKWYHIRLRVTKEKIEAWLDDAKVVDIATDDYTFSVRIEVEASRPLGFSTYYTTAALKNITVKKL